MRTRSTVFSDFDSPAVLTSYKRTSCDSPLSKNEEYKWLMGVRHTKTITDVETPGFQALLKCGRFLPLNPVTIKNSIDQKIPYSDYNPRWGPISQSCPTTDAWQDSGSFGDDTDFSLSPPEVSESELNAAVNGAIANARESAWDVLTFLAEFRETQELFRTAIERVRHFGRLSVQDAIRNLKRLPKKKQKIERLREFFGQSWLEYRYGWMPVIYDLNSAIDAYVKHVNPIERGRAAFTIPFSLSRQWMDRFPYDIRSFSEILTGEHLVRGWAAAEIKNTAMARYGYDPLVTAWEKVPFSFVIDWFFQVGTWIQAATPFAAGHTLGSCVSIRTTCRHELYRQVVATTGGTFSYASGATGLNLIRVKTIDQYQRFAHSGGAPGWNPVITWKRTLDALALVSGLSRDIQRRLRI